MLEVRPRFREAEHWTDHNGIVVETTTDAGGGVSAAFINSGDWLMYRDLNLTNVNDISIRVASNTQGGTIQARTGSVTGPVAGTSSG